MFVHLFSDVFDCFRTVSNISGYVRIPPNMFEQFRTISNVLGHLFSGIFEYVRTVSKMSELFGFTIVAVPFCTFLLSRLLGQPTLNTQVIVRRIHRLYRRRAVARIHLRDVVHMLVAMHNAWWETADAKRHPDL